jgi:hypothetical protein
VWSAATEKKSKQQRDKDRIDKDLTGDSVDILAPQGFWEKKRCVYIPYITLPLSSLTLI